MKPCVLCGGTEFRDDQSGLQCVACGAINGPYDPPGGFDDLMLEYAQDTASFLRQNEVEEEEFWEREHSTRDL